MKLPIKAVVASPTPALALTGAVAVVAQEPTPHVTVRVTPSDITVTGADALRSGPTRFVMSSAGKAERGVIVVRLKDGVTREQAAKAARKITSPAQGERRIGRFVTSALLARGRPYATTTELAAGEYVVLDITKRPVVRAGFTVGTEPNTATMPVATSTIVADDYSFELPDGLRRDGPFVVENRGEELHHVLAFPIKRKVRAKKVVRSLMRDDEPKGLRGTPAAVTEIVSGGTANAVEGRFVKGRILFVCFLQDGPRKPPHAALGMYKAVRVK
jgi:hypothetical protein